MVNDHPLAMEEPLPSLSSVLSPPEIEKGTIEIEELPPPPPPPPAEIKHHQGPITITSRNRRAWMPSRPRQIPHQHQGNRIINVKEQDEQPLHPNNRRIRKVDLHKEIMHHLPKEQDGTTSIDTVAHQHQHHQQPQQHPHEQAIATSIPNDDSTSTSTSTSTSQPIITNYNNNLGSKPKLSNMSLLSSAVAYATLERCLLGRNEGGDNTNDEENENNDEVDVAAQGLQSHPNANNFPSTSSVSSSSSLLSLPPPNYSKQCKAGHIIDILELRRLSSRGVPDEPPEIRVAHHHHHHHHDGENVVDGPHSITTSMGLLSHRSYRPLVWRVLLGYLPPQTSLWNMVLDRDRQLYEMLVQELFSTTCPGPHEYYTTMHQEEEEVDKALFCHGEGQDKNQVHDAAAPADTTTTTTASTAVVGIRNDKQKNTIENGSDFVIDEDDDYDDDDQEVIDAVANIDVASPPRTPIESPDEDATTSTATITTTTATTTPLTTTPHTPGLLSARMQLEWIRGEKNGGGNSVFGGQNHHHPYSSGSSSPSTMTRTSPMCSMNTPRTRIYETTRMKASDEGVASIKEFDDAPRTISEDIAAELADIEHSSSSSILLDSGNVVEGVLSHRLKESLLLPDEEDEEGGNEVVMETINVNNATEEDATPDLRKKTPSKSEDSWGMKNFLPSNNSSFDSVDDDDDDAGAILPTTTSTTRRSLVSSSPSPSPENDEEENMLLLDEIRKDVIRTHPDLRFFLEPEEGLGQKRYAALERILFVWAKLNKGVRYVQGMNEIVGTLYFVLAHDSNEEWSNHAEADTYFLFNALMVEMRDVFVPALDEADTGIHGRINNMITLLSLHDPEIRCHLDSVGIDPSFYSVRWLTTLLSREFLLPDTIRLWDSMFASTHKDNFLRYVSVTMVMVIREELLSGDFSTCMRLLQAYPPTNLDRLLESSRALWIYESQITLACHKGGISLGHALRSIAPPPAIVMAYGLPGGVAPPIRQQVRQVGERGFAAARGAANGASTTVVSAGRNFLGNAMSFWRDSKSSMGDGI